MSIDLAEQLCILCIGQILNKSKYRLRLCPTLGPTRNSPRVQLESDQFKKNVQYLKKEPNLFLKIELIESVTERNGSKIMHSKIP